MANYIRDTKYRWPRGVVPYTVHSDLDEAEVEQAVEIWNGANAGIRFEKYTGSQVPPPPPLPPGPPPQLPSYVRFVPGNEGTICRSEVGRRRPGQRIYCDPARDNMIHEMGHALGLFHEQQRSDRDQHVSVHLQNIIRSRRSDFAKTGSDEASTFSAYDFDSVMHYNDSSGAVDFSPDRALPGIGTDLPPAVTFFDGELHLVCSDFFGTIFHVRSTNLTQPASQEWIQDQSSKAGANLAAFAGDLFMVHVGLTSDDVWISRSADGQTFQPNRRIQRFTSRGVPAMAAFDNKLHLVWTDINSQIKHSWSATGNADDWSSPRAIGQTSKAAVGLTATSSGLHLMHLGQTSSDLWYSVCRNGRNWSENERIGQQSKTTPALTAIGDAVHLVHLGATANEIWHSVLAPGAAKFSYNRETNQLSRRRPSLATGILAGQPTTVLAHLGDTSEKVYLSRYAPTLVTMTSIDPAHPGRINGSSSISLRDAAAVRHMYD